MSESRFRGFGQLSLSDEPSVRSIDKPSSLIGKYDDPDFVRPDSYEVEPFTNSGVRQNFHTDVEKYLIMLINQEITGSYTYRSMSFHFDSCDVALRGFARFFMDCADVELGCALELGKIVNRRGGRVVLFDVKKPSVRGWGNGLDTMQAALELQKNLIENLHELHKLCIKVGDPHMEKKVKEYICKQVVVIKKLGKYVVILKKNTTKLGEYIFDQETLKGKLIIDSDCSSSSSSSSSDSDSD